MSRDGMFTMVALLFALALSGCSSCSDDGGALDAGLDSGSDADGDTDSDSDTDTDVDTSWDAGPLTPCDEDAGVGPPHYVCIPGANYAMGCMPYDPLCTEEEQPMVTVHLSPFWIDKEEATYEDILPFINHLALEGYENGYSCGGNGCWLVTEEPPFKPIFVSYGSDEGTFIEMNDAGVFEWDWEADGDEICGWVEENDAAGGLSWLGAKLYCEWRGMRLPTEAEWEAAARGRRKWVWPCAWTGISCYDGRFDECHTGDMCADPDKYECCVPEDDYGAYECNSPDGVSAMLGNAAEWVLDWGTLGTGHDWCASGCTDPAPRNGDLPGYKGGSVIHTADETRISSRSALDDGTLSIDGRSWTGVRCVKSAVSHTLADGGVDWGG